MSVTASKFQVIDLFNIIRIICTRLCSGSLDHAGILFLNGAGFWGKVNEKNPRNCVDFIVFCDSYEIQRNLMRQQILFRR